MTNSNLSARAVSIALAIALLCVAPPAAAGAQEQGAGRALLDVPYVPQTPELCGGAAVAMVLRYWGERQVFPEDFESLVVASERGIPTGALSAAVRQRNWQAVVVMPDGGNPHSRIRDALARRQPLIALIEVSPRTYHYVVIVGATDEEVVVHDPARSPFRVVPWAEFDRAWAAAGQWMMLILPPETRVKPAPVSPAETGGGPQTPCEALVQRGVALAEGGDKQSTEEALVGATRVCPTHPAAWRELAGWRFSQSRWAEAQVLALTAVRLAPEDAHARELLATSRYLAGDVMGALDAWTPAGEPRIDAVIIHGAERTRHPVVAGAAGLEPRQVLTAEVFGRALRRVQALPVAGGARMQYEPLEGGLAKVDVSLSERDPYPRGWIAVAILGSRAAVGHELKLDAAGLFGAGERISASGRWQEERPRVAFGLAAPSPSWIPGVISFEGMWERQSYPDVRETRRRLAAQVTDWTTSWLRWKAGVALDRFDGRRHLSFEGGVDLRLARDRIALVASRAQWLPAAGENGFASSAMLVAWRSTGDPTRGAWSALSEISAATSTAPMAVWEGAGTGSARTGLLRAHPLMRDGVLTGPAFGRGLGRGTLEYARPAGHTLAGTISIAGFVDAARAWHRTTVGRSPLFIDAGLGVRLRAPGRNEGVRLDVAHGLRGGGTTLSVGWLAGWPR